MIYKHNNMTETTNGTNGAGGTKKQSSWMQALKQFNSTREKWLLPKKDTPEYAEVLKIKDSLKATTGQIPPLDTAPTTPDEQVVKPKKPRKPRVKRDSSVETI